MSDVVLGFGAMRLPLRDENDNTSIDMEQMKDMVDCFMDKGFDYFDTSFVYHSESSENALKHALVERYPRSSFRIADKIPTWRLTSPDDNRKLVDIMLERLGVDYFDVLLIHNINPVFMETAEECGCFEFLAEMKERGIARKVGISFHGKADLLEEVLNQYSDIIDVVQIQLNFMDWKDQTIQSAKCHRVCMKYKKEIIVMEPLKGGTLFRLPEEIKNQFSDDIAGLALRFAGSQNNISTVLSGMGSLDEVKENCDTFTDFERITSEERRYLMRLSGQLRDSFAIKCNSCGYCVNECEEDIAIPDFFNLYNSQKIHSLVATESLYNVTATHHAPASACNECGKCTEVCTQSLDIPLLLKDVVEMFENE